MTLWQREEREAERESNEARREKLRMQRERFSEGPKELPSCRMPGCDHPVIARNAMCIACQVKLPNCATFSHFTNTLKQKALS